MKISNKLCSICGLVSKTEDDETVEDILTTRLSLFLILSVDKTDKITGSPRGQARLRPILPRRVAAYPQQHP